MSMLIIMMYIQRTLSAYCQSFFLISTRTNRQSQLIAFMKASSAAVIHPHQDKSSIVALADNFSFRPYIAKACISTLYESSRPEHLLLSKFCCYIIAILIREEKFLAHPTSHYKHEKNAI
jgi:hypothetical protein